MSEPIKIEIERVMDGLGCMGIEDGTTIRGVTVTPHAVSVTRYRLTEDGHRYVENGQVATVTVVMPIDYPKPAEPGGHRAPEQDQEFGEESR